jgi:hypothetical protein
MRICGHTFACLFVIAMLTTHMRGQQPTIRTNVPLVTVPVSVADRHGWAIYDLDRSDFVVLDNGRTGVTVYSFTYSAYLTPFTIKPEEYEPSGGSSTPACGYPALRVFGAGCNLEGYFVPFSVELLIV